MKHPSGLIAKNLVGLVCVLGFGACVTPPVHREPAPGGWGKFSGPVRTEWIGPRKMKLLEQVQYIEPNGKVWIAPKDSIVDGASIPRAFWSVIGGPFDGGYRDASVIHDIACDQRHEKWQDAHSMFYRAMRASGVSPRKAKTMFAAVWHYGPKWPTPARGVLAAFAPKPSESSPPPPTKAEARAVRDWVAEENPGPTTISLAPKVPGT